MNDNFLGDLFSGNSGIDLNGLDINKILVILLIIFDKLDIEVIHIYKKDFAVTLGTFNNNL